MNWRAVRRYYLWPAERLNRADYWSLFLLPAYGGALLHGVAGTPQLSAWFYLAIIWPVLVGICRRLNDFNCSAWWCVLSFLPTSLISAAGFTAYEQYYFIEWPIVILVVGLIPGHRGANSFGEPPRTEVLALYRAARLHARTILGLLLLALGVYGLGNLVREVPWRPSRLPDSLFRTDQTTYRWLVFISLNLYFLSLLSTAYGILRLRKWSASAFAITSTMLSIALGITFGLVRNDDVLGLVAGYVFVPLPIMFLLWSFIRRAIPASSN